MREAIWSEEVTRYPGLSLSVIFGGPLNGTENGVCMTPLSIKRGLS